MITKVIIKDNKKAPIRYLMDLKNFKNGSTWEFKPGVNIIVGQNGCGKTTLLRLICNYLMVDETECGKGVYNSNISRLFYGNGTIEDGISSNLLDGVDVYADYKRNVFRLCHAGEKSNDGIMSSFESFGEFFEQRHASTGEGVIISINALLQHMFSEKAELNFNYDQFLEYDSYKPYVDYVNAHRVDCEDEWTILLDEPDRNLDITKIDSIRPILDYRKPHTQVIAVIHNPLLIYSLSEVEHINFIEMTPNYVSKVKKAVDKLIKPKKKKK